MPPATGWPEMIARLTGAFNAPTIVLSITFWAERWQSRQQSLFGISAFDDLEGCWAGAGRNTQEYIDNPRFYTAQLAWLHSWQRQLELSPAQVLSGIFLQ